MALDETMDRATTALDAGDAQGAVRALRETARDPLLPEVPAALGRFVGLAGRAGGLVGLDALAARCAAAVTLGDQALYDAGWQLVDARLPELALPVLRRLRTRHPGHVAVANELGCALRDVWRCGEALDVLLATPGASDVLLVGVALASGRLDLARERIGRLDPADPSADVFAGVLGRAERLAGASPLDDRDLRGWQYVLSGTLLLHLSPHGFDDGMRGRWAFVQDHPSQLRLGLDRARAVLGAWDRVPDAILALPDPGSRALAGAAGRVWGVPVRPFAPDTRGLAVVYDPDRLDERSVAALAQHRGLTYAHAACWTAPPSVVPDLVTVLYQHLVAPWDAGLRLDPATGRPARTPASADPPEAWAARIAEAEPCEDVLPHDDLEALSRFAGRAPPDRGPRRPWPQSPVASGRFA